LIPTPLTLTSPFKITSIDPVDKTECSYAGGCELTITSNGLYHALLDSSKSYINVCGTKLDVMFDYKLDAKGKPTTETVPSKVMKFKIPSLSTKVSNTLFKIAEVTEDLKTGVPFGTGAEVARVFDNDLLNDSGDLTE